MIQKKWGLAASVLVLVVTSSFLGGLLPTGSEARSIQPAPGGPLDTALQALGPDYWPMYLHDASHSSTNPNDTVISAANASSLVVSWTSQLTHVPKGSLASVIASSAEVVGNTVYDGAWDGNMSALYANNGTTIWGPTYLGQTNVTNCKSPRGITSSSAIYDGKVYVGGGNDYWYVLNATTGAVLNKTYVGDSSDSGGNYNWASPVIYDNMEYIGVASDCDSPLVRGELIQVNATTYNVVNRFYTVPSGHLGGTIWTTPTIDDPDNELIVATGNCNGNNYAESLYCGATIALKLSNISQVVGHWQDTVCSIPDCDIPTTPTLFTSGGVRMVADGDKNGTVWAFKAADISAGPVWSTKVANGGDIEKGRGLAATGVFTGKYLVYAGQAGTVKATGTKYAGIITALDPSNGTIAWQTGLPDAETTFGATVYENGAIIEGGGNLLNFSGSLFLLNATNGHILYDHYTPGLFYDSATVARGHIFIGSYLGTLYSFGLPLSLHISSFTATPSTIALGNTSQFSTSIAGESGTVTYHYTGLPLGCTSANSPTLSCTPTVTGTFVVTVNVTDTGGGSDQAQTTLTVLQPYPVTFSETGLPLTTSWSVTLNGTLKSTTGTSIVFNETKGSYPFTVGTVTGYVATPPNGSAVVNGAPVSEPIVWTHAVASKYAVSFSETGLPSGTSWSVTLNGAPNSSTSATIGFSEPNDTYPYSLGYVAGFTPPSYSGSVMVAGHAVAVDVPWSKNASVYSVSFTESGLPSGTHWSVTLNGTLAGSSGTSITFSEPNGSYPFSVGTISGYAATPASGSVTVVGKDTTQIIGFSSTALALYTITIQETGLPSGASWSVLINGTQFSSSSSAISVQRANGTYGVSVNGVAGFRADTYAFSVQVAGSDVSKTIVWSTVTYSVSFLESGLSKGSTWVVTLGGSLLSSTSTTIVFTEVNGSYDYSVGSVAGYNVTPTLGNVQVAGKNVTEPVVFAAQSGGSVASSGFWGLDTELLTVAVLLAAGGVVAFVLRRRRSAPPTPPAQMGPPENP